MSYYSKEEQETIYNYDVIEKRWRVYSTYPPHIKTLLEKSEIIRTVKDEVGVVIAVDGYAEPSQVRFYS